MLCEIDARDSEILIEFKSQIKRLIVDKFDLQDVHWIATYLDPGYKNFGFIKNDIIRKAMLDKTRSLIAVRIAEIKLPEIDCEGGTGMRNHTENSTAKKRKLDIFDAVRNDVSQNSEDLSEYAELDKYASASAPGSKNPLDFWRAHQKDLPRLAQVAAQVLAITASSAPSERCFSAAGRIIEERRTSLKPETVDCLIRVRSYILNKRNN